ncbi:hypothetical protein PV08_05052 [Exophiala spinifera]|uniref:Uncharacterized protein n=1 Tax=Exophiala spinifera TaxID=91928 RepID=A0A0D1ZYW7_9EURO|nr:uncharacterized protein PV08_05052 [Exophiala spinifera]KIW17857.1 hypothetical protein PV08_05052 [Exophiala spinifera]
MSSQSTFYETADWPLQPSPRNSAASSLSLASENASIHFSNFPLPPTPSTSRPPSDTSRVSSSTAAIHTIHVPLSRPFTISFLKGSKLFRLRFSQIELEKNVAGSVKRILLSDSSATVTPMIHSFSDQRLPIIPHLEQPVTSTSSHISRISFLEEQTLQSGQTLFQAEPQYTFEAWEDCVKFQEAILGQTIVFTAGIAEAKSKGRGEECISQNLRVLRGRTGRQVILFFTNSQRRERKKYITIPRKYPMDSFSTSRY